MDFATLSYVQAGMLLVNLFVLLILWQTNTEIAGTKSWVWGSFLMCIGTFALGLFIQAFPYGTFSVIATLVILLGYYLYYVGLCQFHGVQAKNKLFFTFFLILAAFLLYLDCCTSQAKFWRVTLGSLGIGVLSIGTAIHYYAFRYYRIKIADAVLLSIFGTTGLVWTTRSILTLSKPPVSDFGYNRPIDVASFFVTIFFLVFLGMGILLKVTSRLQSHWRRQAVTDPLTGIFNRRGFFMLAQAMLNQSKKFNKKIILAMIDLDYFKSINDDFGHDAGDKVLQTFANILLDTIRSRDLAARYGGEEFVLLFTGADEQEAEKVIKRVSTKFQKESAALPEIRRPLTMSGGVASSSSRDLKIQKLIYRADQALLRAKKNGRNRVEIA